MTVQVGVEKFFARALDPVHIGAGGYRLGRVDNTIVREPATDVPKIPGTSLAGVVREFYTIYCMENDNNCKNKADIKEKRACAEERAKEIFGDETRKGILRFYDGQIVFFPVASMVGTVWVTTKELLEYWANGERIPEDVEDKAYVLKGDISEKDIKGEINLGWLLLEVRKSDIKLEDILPYNNVVNWVNKKVVVVSEKLFSHIVNDNLEVRTSVKIDPITGTAEEGKLFTYEAIPRGTVFGFEVGIDPYRKEIEEEAVDIMKKVKPYLECLGIGGMGTRGFGRIELSVMEGGGDEKS